MRFKLFLWMIVFAFLPSCGFWQQDAYQGYVEGEFIYLASPFYGILENLAIERGHFVKKGDLLFQLDKDPQELELASANAQLQEAKNTLADLKKAKRKEVIDSIKAQIKQVEAEIVLAKLRVHRTEILYKKQAIDKDSVDAAVAKLNEQIALKHQYQANLADAKLGARADQIRAQQSQVNSLEAKYEQAKWNLEQKTMYAPTDGLIFDTYYENGEFVGASQAVLSLLTKDNIRIEFFIPVTELAKVKTGQQIHFSCEGCAADNKAVISYISPEAEYLPPLVYSRENNDKLVFRIKAHIENPFAFKPGQPVMVTL